MRRENGFISVNDGAEGSGKGRIDPVRGAAHGGRGGADLPAEHGDLLGKVGGAAVGVLPLQNRGLQLGRERFQRGVAAGAAGGAQRHDIAADVGVKLERGLRIAGGALRILQLFKLLCEPLKLLRLLQSLLGAVDGGERLAGGNALSLGVGQLKERFVPFDHRFAAHDITAERNAVLRTIAIGQRGRSGIDEIAVPLHAEIDKNGEQKEEHDQFC